MIEKSKEKFLIGIDFGTDSVRTLIINAETGTEESNCVSVYKRWADGKFCDPSNNQFRQHPLDYIEGLVSSVRLALEAIPSGLTKNVASIGIDTTGSTPCITDNKGRPLALQDRFKENPDAMFILWKDHTSIEEAEQINNVSRHWGGVDFTKYSGGSYSSEWFWAKLLHVLRKDTHVRNAAYSCIEHCDWMPALLTGKEDIDRIKRSRCAAGHKAMWHSEWNGLPDEKFWVNIDNLLKGFRKKLYAETFTSNNRAGVLIKEWAEKLGLEPGIPVAVGILDAHSGALGAGIKPRTLAKIIGTSTCDMMVAPPDVIGNKLIRGISGQVDGSIIPDMIGLEAGQSAFGDVYAWFRDLLSWPLDSFLLKTNLKKSSLMQKVKKEIKESMLQNLAKEASKIGVEDTGLIALDWLNGRRNPDADYSLKGAIAGLNLGTSAPKIYRSLVEATAYGAKSIVERFVSYGIEIEEVIALGGIPKKSPFVMQVISDVLDVPIKISTSEQATALGAAMCGGVASGVYRTIQEAQEKIGSGFDKTYVPDKKNANAYKGLYQKYLLMGGTLEEQLRKM